MRTPFRLIPLISLVDLATLLVPAMPARGMAESGAIITVSSMDDELNNDGNCSLREAVRAANTNTPVDACMAGIGYDKIVLPEGFYLLSIAGVVGVEEDNALSGDLDIREDLVIEGAGKVLSVIDGGGIDRVFQIIGAITVEMSRLTIQNGRAPVTASNQFGGGGILNHSGVLNMNEVSILNNHSTGVGGGITNMSSLTLTDSFVSGNQAEAGGGIYNGDTLSIIRSTLYANTAEETGGGLDDSGNVTLENVTISGNVADSGGGVFSDGSVTLLHSSVLNNSAHLPGNGGNIHSVHEFFFYNTLVANSLAGPNCFGSGLNSLGFNLEGQTLGEYTCNFGQNFNDPQVGPLQDNGGLTPTHALLEGSPAIDAGDDQYCPDRDQRGALRPADGDGDDTKVCDIGAFEYDGIFPTNVFLPVIVR